MNPELKSQYDGFKEIFEIWMRNHTAVFCARFPRQFTFANSTSEDLLKKGKFITNTEQVTLTIFLLQYFEKLLDIWGKVLLSEISLSSTCSRS